MPGVKTLVGLSWYIYYRYIYIYERYIYIYKRYIYIYNIYIYVKDIYILKKYLLYIYDIIPKKTSHKSCKMGYCESTISSNVLNHCELCGQQPPLCRAESHRFPREIILKTSINIMINGQPTIICGSYGIWSTLMVNEATSNKNGWSMDDS